jgi:hypothetical protein
MTECQLIKKSYIGGGTKPLSLLTIACFKSVRDTASQSSQSL